MICISISGMEELGAVPGTWDGLLELRLDLMGTDPELVFSRIPETCKTIATCRPGSISDQKRMAWLKAAMELGASLVDVEVEAEDSYLDELSGFAAKRGAELIVSFHDFTATPDRETLGARIRECWDRGAHIAKVATMVRSEEDILNLLSLYQVPGRKVVLGMGDMGRITRVVAPYLGADFTFASPVQGKGTAPGQLDFKTLTQLYQVIDQS